MTNEQHIAAGHIRVVSNDKICFWVEPITYEPVTIGSFDLECFSDPLNCETISLSEWQDYRSTKFDELMRGG